jgi:flagellar biosynthesis/type III secretory pathway protein FliH
MDVEKQAFEQGYAEGERIGKEMGEKMVAAVVKRYDTSVGHLAEPISRLSRPWRNKQFVWHWDFAQDRPARADNRSGSRHGISGVALKRVANHQSLTLRVSRQDFGRVRVAVANINPVLRLKTTQHWIGAIL